MNRIVLDRAHGWKSARRTCTASQHLYRLTVMSAARRGDLQKARVRREAHVSDSPTIGQLGKGKNLPVFVVDCVSPRPSPDASSLLAALMPLTCFRVSSNAVAMLCYDYYSIEEEEEEFYKLRPANKTDHLCQSWQ